MSAALVIYSWPRLWSMGERRGSPDFYHSLLALTRAFDEVQLICPRDSDSTIARQVPPGVKVTTFNRWNLPLIPSPRGLRFVRVAIFCLNWPLRLLNYLLFNYFAHRTAFRVCAHVVEPSVVSAHGFMGVRTAVKLATYMRVPLAVRLFGVSLGIRGFSWHVLAAQFEETTAFKAKATRWIITDDGSGGMQAALNFGVPEEQVTMTRAGVERCESVPEGDNLRRDYRTKLGLSTETKIVLRVCRLWPQQHVERLIEALPPGTADGTPVVAVIVGEGEERERLEYLAVKLGKKVVFTGALANNELASHYRAADLYVATADRTNLSQSVLEAMSHGLPVLALNSGDTSSLITDMENGLLVPPGNAGELVAKIIKVLDDDSLRRRLAAGALATAKAEIPDVENRIKAEAEIYQEMISTD